MKHIGTIFAKSDGTTLAPADFAPFVIPTTQMLELVAQGGGPVIDIDDIVGKVVALPLAQLDAGTLLHTRLLIESSETDEHGEVLEAVRSAEFQRLFEFALAASEAQVNAYLEIETTRAAMSLVNFIIDGARAFADGGPDNARSGEISVRFLDLK